MPARPPGITAGRLRPRVDLVDPAGPASTADADGQPVAVPRTAAAGVPACVESVPESAGGTEAVVGDAVRERSSHRITLRYHPGLAAAGPAWRVVNAGKVYELDAVVDWEDRRTWLVCLCRLAKGVG